MFASGLQIPVNHDGSYEDNISKCMYIGTTTRIAKFVLHFYWCVQSLVRTYGMTNPRRPQVDYASNGSEVYGTSLVLRMTRDRECHVTRQPNLHLA